jgi:uncharacterized membrane protein HdeD (DUF308 family)
MRNEESSFSWNLLVLGIIYIILALIAFNNPGSGILVIVFLFAFGAISKGIFEIVYRKRLSRFRTLNQTGLVILGIFEIVIGILLLANYWIGIVAVPFIFAVWFIVDSVGAIFVATAFREVNNSFFWFSLILGIIGLIIGIFLLMNPITGFLTVEFLVGAFFMLGGIVSLIEAF